MPSTALVTAPGGPRICLEFRKVHGAGNDFVLITVPFECADLPGLARELCTRQTGIGADGLVVSTRLSSDPPAYEVRCLNPDGSEATMCGNAPRCAALCAASDYGHTKVSIVMAGVRHRAEVRGAEVAVTAEAGPVLRAAAAVENDERICEFDSVPTEPSMPSLSSPMWMRQTSRAWAVLPAITAASPRRERTSASCRPQALTC